MTDETKPIQYGKPMLVGDTYLSPEGVEEKVVKMETFFITLTQGGKYRAYVSMPPTARVEPMAADDDLKKMEKGIASCMMLTGGMVISPEKTANVAMEMLTSMFNKHAPKL